MHFLLLLFAFIPGFAIANQCQDFFTNTQTRTPVVDPESFFAAMTEGMILGQDHSCLFEFYRTRFGNPQGDVGGKNLQTVLSLLAKHPELEKHLFREQILEQVVKVYSPPPELRAFIQAQLRSSGQLRSNLFQIDANIGYWKKLIPSEDPALFARILNMIVDAKSREELKLTNSDSATNNTKALFRGLRHYRRWLKTQPGSEIYLQRLNQAMVDLVHIAGFWNKSLTEQLRTPDALLQIQAYRKILDARDEMAMALGYPGHFIELQEKLGVHAPTGIDPVLAQRVKNTQEDGLVQKLADFEARSMQSEFTLKPTETVRIRSLSIIEAPFRTCLGGSDCSSRTYFSKALDPNFHYFTMTDNTHSSSGHVTVVLGTAKNANGQNVNVAFIDKIQNVPNTVLPVFLEGVRRSLAEKDYFLVMPEDVGDHNGLSNIEGTRSFVRTELLPNYQTRHVDFVPHSHNYNFENEYSRAYQKLSVRLVEPTILEEHMVLSPGTLREPYKAPEDLSIETLMAPIMSLGASTRDSDVLQFLALSQSVEGFEEFGFDTARYWTQVEKIFNTTKNDAIKKQALYSLILNKQRDDLLVETNFSPELWQQLLGEIPQWGMSSSEDKKQSWTRISNFNKQMIEGTFDEFKAYLKSPFLNMNQETIRNLLYSIVAYSRTEHQGLEGVQIIKYLISEYNFNITTPITNGENLLHLAAQYGFLDIIPYLISFPEIDINAQDKDGNTALHLAFKSSYSNYNILSLLINDLRIELNIKNREGNSPLHCLLNVWDKNQNIKIYQSLAKENQLNKFDLNLQNNDGKTVLMLYAEKGISEVVEIILNQPGLDINLQDKNNETAFMYSLKSKNPETIKLFLLLESLDLNSIYVNFINFIFSDKTYETEGDYIEYQIKNYELLELYSLNEKLDPITKVSLVGTLISFGKAKLAAAVLKDPNIDINSRYQGRHATILMFAAQTVQGNNYYGGKFFKFRESMALVQILLNNPNLDINAQDQDGNTALMWGIEYLNDEFVEALLKHPKIDINIMNRRGETALSILKKIWLKYKGYTRNSFAAGKLLSLLETKRDQ